jgi:alkylation response protein AidB-like acyl-CoA dehydrogenase
MNFGFTDDQQAIKRTAHEFLADRYPMEEVRRLAGDARGFTDAQWEEIVALGWPGMFVSEADGGLGLGIVELCILQEELGYALAPTPFLSTAAAGLLIAAAGDEARRERFLARLAAGERRGTVALFDADAGAPPRVEADRLTGAKIAVPDAATADFLVIAGSGGTPWVLDSDTDGVSVEPTEGIDPTRKLAAVRLDGAPAAELSGGDPGDLDRAWAAIATALAAESVGVAQRALEMSVAYARERKQFGRPIGAYQAVSHRCAQMLLETESARSLVYYAAWACDHEPASAPLAGAMAKAYASDAGFRVPAAAIQVHGGIGFTWEADLHFLLKRGTANARAFGDARAHRTRVAELVGALAA